MAGYEMVDSALLQDLILNLDEIRDYPHTLSCALPLAWISQVLVDTDGRPAEPGQVKLELLDQGGAGLLVMGSLRLSYCVPCARCLADATVDVDSELTLTCVLESKVRRWTGRSDSDDEGLALESGELDHISYDGKTLDLRAALAEQALLAYPMRTMCSLGELCRGLCGSCGFDLNQRDRDHRCSGRSLEAAAADDGAKHTSDVNLKWQAALNKVKPS